MSNADATVYWDAKTELSRYIPGAIAYSVKSIPAIIRQMEEMAQTKISNDIASANLVSRPLQRCIFMSAAPGLQHVSLEDIPSTTGIHKDQWHHC